MPKLKKTLYKKLVHPLTFAVAEVVTNELVKAVVPPLFDGLVDDVKRTLEGICTYSYSQQL